MSKDTLRTAKSQAGFTLVELAIVMIIIGLLIAGVLKGQQLIGNARVTSQVAQFKGVDGAVSTFRDMYNGVPGDLAAAATRLNNCAAAPCAPGGANLGDNIVSAALPGTGVNFSAAPDAQQTAFFIQLNAADLLTGINPAQGLVWGGDFPAGKIAGGLHAGSAPGNACLNSQVGCTAANVRSGLYIALHGTPAGAVAGAGIMGSNEAQRVDTKVDDGVPGTGSVLPAGAANCLNGAGGYNEIVQGNNCNLYVRIQG